MEIQHLEKIIEASNHKVAHLISYLLDIKEQTGNKYLNIDITTVSKRLACTYPTAKKTLEKAIELGFISVVEIRNEKFYVINHDKLSN